MKFIISVLLSILSFNLFAGDICSTNHFSYFNTKIQTGTFKNTNKCFISISPRQYYNLAYRNHIFTSTGEHMIFNSFGPGPSQSQTGARVYVYLPRTMPLSYSLQNAQLTLTLANGSTITFDAKNSQIIDSIGIDIQESPSVQRNNQGGVEVYSSENIWIDFGFTFGHSPLLDMNRWHDIHLEDKSCRAINSDLLSRQGSEIFWKYEGDRELIYKLRSLCEQ